VRINSTSFTHASTAIFGVAVVGYAAVRLISYAAPHIPAHLPGHHVGAPASPLVRQFAERHHTGQRASRSAHRSPMPPRLAPHGGQPATTRLPSVARTWVGASKHEGESLPSWQPTPWPTRTGGEREDWRASHPAATSTPSNYDTHEPGEDESGEPDGPHNED
jgi:hypothetical protein